MEAHLAVDLEEVVATDEVAVAGSRVLGATGVDEEATLDVRVLTDIIAHAVRVEGAMRVLSAGEKARGERRALRAREEDDAADGARRERDKREEGRREEAAQLELELPELAPRTAPGTGQARSQDPIETVAGVDGVVAQVEGERGIEPRGEVDIAHAEGGARERLVGRHDHAEQVVQVVEAPSEARRKRPDDAARKGHGPADLLAVAALGRVADVVHAERELEVLLEERRDIERDAGLDRELRVAEPRVAEEIGEADRGLRGRLEQEELAGDVPVHEGERQTEAHLRRIDGRRERDTEVPGRRLLELEVEADDRRAGQPNLGLLVRLRVLGGHCRRLGRRRGVWARGRGRGGRGGRRGRRGPQNGTQLDGQEDPELVETPLGIAKARAVEDVALGDVGAFERAIGVDHVVVEHARRPGRADQRPVIDRIDDERVVGVLGDPVVAADPRVEEAGAPEGTPNRVEPRLIRLLGPWVAALEWHEARELALESREALIRLDVVGLAVGGKRGALFASDFVAGTRGRPFENETHLGHARLFALLDVELGLAPTAAQFADTPAARARVEVAARRIDALEAARVQGDVDGPDERVRGGCVESLRARRELGARVVRRHGRGRGEDQRRHALVTQRTDDIGRRLAAVDRADPDIHQHTFALGRLEFTAAHERRNPARAHRHREPTQGEHE